MYFCGVQVNPPNPEEAALVENRTLISLLFPAQNGDLVKQLEGQGATVMSMDCIPRMLSRGQTYDVLSSQVGGWLGAGEDILKRVVVFVTRRHRGGLFFCVAFFANLSMFRCIFVK